MNSNESHLVLWSAIGIGAFCAFLGLTYTELQATHPSVALVTLLVVGGGLGLYATLAPFLGLPLPRTRTQPFWRHQSAQPSLSPKEERALLDNLFLFLDGRRVLFDPMTSEEPSYVLKSISEIRQHLNDDLERVGACSAARPYLLSMRKACLTYLTIAPNKKKARANWPHAINALREGVRQSIEDIEHAYSLSMPGGTGRAIATRYLSGPDSAP